VRELARADVVHVFSASYTSFLLAPLPAMLVARALGRPVVLNYRSGQATDHLKRSAIARKSIEEDGGTLSVRDLPGSGCVFTISLPRQMLS